MILPNFDFIAIDRRAWCALNEYYGKKETYARAVRRLLVEIKIKFPPQ
jgi:hypothetical protein